jgi:predicted ATPase/DNA-binding winged helix-turn-helix (wHTH) protein
MPTAPLWPSANIPRESPFVFGPFEFFDKRKLLRHRGEPVRLGARAIDLLQALLRQPGQILSQRELVAHVWPNTVVEDSNLRVHVAALRRALGDAADGIGYISNVPGRGYRFAAEVVHVAPPPAAGPAPAAAAPSPRLYRLGPCGRLGTIIGRRRDVAALGGQLRTHRLLTLVGPGGVGKTALGLAVATRAQDHFPGGVFHVDLGDVRPDAGLPAELDAIARAMRTEAAAGSGVLCMLDNCEHLIGAAATLAVRLLLSCPGLTLLATSREPLAIDGEALWRVGALAAPPAAQPHGVSPRAYPALQLLLARAGEVRGGAALDGADLRRAASICRRLDGLPLAIEMAAASIGTLGLKAVADQLGRAPLQPGAARRHVPARHASLQACYGWSHALLPAPEQRLFQRLAGFTGSFSLADVGALSGELDATPQDLTVGLMALVAKSLVMADLRAVDTTYCLLRTARAYALAQQAASPVK